MMSIMIFLNKPGLVLPSYVTSQLCLCYVKLDQLPDVVELFSDRLDRLYPDDSLQGSIHFYQISDVQFFCRRSAQFRQKVAAAIFDIADLRQKRVGFGESFLDLGQNDSRNFWVWKNEKYEKQQSRIGNS